jgi:hypothetical protein
MAGFRLLSQRAHRSSSYAVAGEAPEAELGPLIPTLRDP